MSARATLLLLVLLPSQALGQGFAGLGTDAEGFALPRPDAEFSFPADHGPHPDYRIEWWYLTATLTAEDGRNFGLQWTLFRSAMRPGETEGWQSPQLWMGHAAVTTPDAHFFTERLARGGIGQAGVTAEPFRAWIDDWQMRGNDMSRLSIEASGPEFAYDMQLQATGPLVLHGAGGYSVKSEEGQASYYYSQPFYEISGTLTLPEGEVSVTGDAWLDREWSSQPLSEDQKGWDWFSLTFTSGARLMGFRLRGAEGAPFTSATWIEPDGKATAYGDGAFSAEPLAETEVAGRTLPVRWRVRLPEKGVDVEVEAMNPGAWMATSVPYWEGPVSFFGSHEGRGYLEMTGYEEN